MKKAVFIIVIVLIGSILFAGYAQAGILEKAKSWLTSEVLAFLASALIALLGGTFGILFVRISRTFRELGEFMTTLGTAIEDHRITRDELASIIKEGKDILGVWK